MVKGGDIKVIGIFVVLIMSFVSGVMAVTKDGIASKFLSLNYSADNNNSLKDRFFLYSTVILKQKKTLIPVNLLKRKLINIIFKKKTTHFFLIQPTLKNRRDSVSFYTILFIINKLSFESDSPPDVNYPEDKSYQPVSLPTAVLEYRISHAAKGNFGCTHQKRCCL